MGDDDEYGQGRSSAPPRGAGSLDEMEREFANVLNGARMKRPAAATTAAAETAKAAEAKAAAVPKATPMKVMKAKAKASPPTVVKAKAKAKAKAKGKAQPVKGVTLRYRGVPTSPQPPIEFKDWKIYVSLDRKVWRTLQRGKVVDQQWSWATEPKKSWDRMVKFITSS